MKRVPIIVDTAPTINASRSDPVSDTTRLKLLSNRSKGIASATRLLLTKSSFDMYKNKNRFEVMKGISYLSGQLYNA